MRFKSRSRALVGSALAATLGLAGLALTASPAMAVEDTEVTRVEGLPTYEGGTRYETAAESATTAYPDGAANVVLASGQKFPDALAGGGLAGELDAPILLTPTAALPSATIAALDDLEAETVTILGGVEAVSASVEAELVALGYDTDRVFGDDRFETAVAIAETLGGDTAVLANGLRFPDALAISPGAHELSLPLVLTTAATLHEDAAGYLADDAVENVIIVGGTEVVSQAIEDGLEADGKTVTRLAGDTRYETAVEIAEFHLTVGFTLDELVLATGENFADALTGGPLASQMGNPLVLTQSNTLTPATAAFITENCDEVDALTIMGGVLAISQAVEDAAAAAAQCDAPASATTRPELVSASVVNTTTATQATPTNPAGTTVRFVFDEAVANAGGLAPTAGNFHVYNADAVVANGGGIVGVSGNEVLVFFPTITTTAAAGALTVATVDENAVRQTDGVTNTIGAAPLGTASGGGSVNLPAGITVAPDLISVGNFRQAASAGDTAIDFVFDEAARTTATPVFELVLLDGTVLSLTAPATGDNTAGGGTVAGGNGTTTITVIYDGPAATTPLLTAADVARGVVQAGSVAEQTDNEVPANGLDQNVLQAADVSNNGNTVDPDLVSVELRPGATAAAVDQALFTFDQVVTAASFGDFFLYKADGTTVTGTAVAINPADGRQVLVDFTPTATDNAVGGNVVAGAVTPGNEADEVGVSNTAAAPSQMPGFTIAPDLTGVALSDQTNVFGSVVGTYATYTFDEVVTGITEADYYLYLADGTRLSPVAASCVIGPAAGTADDNTVRCTFAPGGTPASPTYAKAATLGAVDDGAATDGTNASPEGAAFTTGGTGTPAA